MRPGLEKRFLEEAKGDFKLAWQLQKAARGKGEALAHHTPTTHATVEAPKRRRTPRETVVPTRDGSEVTSGRGGGLRAFISAHTVIKYDDGQIAWIWWGYFDAMREGLSGQPDLSAFRPLDVAGDDERWREGAQNRIRGAGTHLPVALGRLPFPVDAAQAAHALRKQSGHCQEHHTAHYATHLQQLGPPSRW